MSRPNAGEARRRRDMFARLVAQDIVAGGLELASRTVVERRRTCKLDPDRALRLVFDPVFVDDVQRLAGITE